VPQASEKKLVNRLFESLIRRCYHETRAILKNNLELLKTMTELWCELIEVPVGMIYDYLSAPSTDQRKLITGIQLFGIVLTNQIDVYDYPTNVSSLDFYRSLISCMRNSSKSMHAPSAEVVGLLLRWLQKKQKLLDNSEAAKKAEQEKFDRVLEDLFQVLSRLELNLFITCVHRIQLNYPPISERCMTKLIHNLPKLYGMGSKLSINRL
jgi:DNA-dependent protein kinase catalytic subunit